MCRGDSRETEHAPAFDSDVGDAETVAELVLTDELLEETIQIRVTRPERRPVACVAKLPNVHCASARGGLATAYPRASA